MAKVIHEKIAARTPQSALLLRLIPIIDDLTKRGAVCHAIELWPNDLQFPDQIGFTITAVFGADKALKARHAHLVSTLSRHGFDVRQTFSTDIGERDIHVTATMKVVSRRQSASPGRGKPSRNGGKRGLTLSTVQ